MWTGLEVRNSAGAKIRGYIHTLVSFFSGSSLRFSVLIGKIIEKSPYAYDSGGVNNHFEIYKSIFSS